MSNVSSTTMSRRSFTRLMATGVVGTLGLAMALEAAQPSPAFADGGTCTCNVWVKPEDSIIQGLIGSGNVAYMTNPTTPTSTFGQFPTEPVENNATYVVTSEGEWTVTIPLVNSMFRLKTVTPNAETGADIDLAASTKDGSYYDTLVVTMPAASATYAFSATEYAGFSLFAGEKSWPIHIELSI